MGKKGHLSRSQVTDKIDEKIDYDKDDEIINYEKPTVKMITSNYFLLILINF